MASFCNDMLGDICGILSGAMAIVIAARAAADLSISPVVFQMITAALVAALTVGGKSLGKGLAMKHNTQIVHGLGRLMYTFSRK